MASPVSIGVGWRQQRPQEEEEEEEEEEEGEPREEEEEDEPQGSVSQTGGNWARRNTDQWNISPSSKEMLGDTGLLEDLKGHQGPLEDDDLGYNLHELQSFDSLGEAEPASPLLECVKDGEDIGHLSPVSHWHPQRDQRGGSFEEQEKPEEEWAEGSEGEPYPELSSEGLYGSEFSTSPEALKDPLALFYKHGNSYSFTSEGEEEELSVNSNLPSPPPGSPPQCTHFETTLGGSRGQLGDSQEFLEEREFSSESGRSPENGGATSLVGSIQWSCSPLGGLSLQDFQNSPGFDSETFPESSWMENVAHLEGNGLQMATSITVQDAQTPKEPKESRLDVSEATEGFRALKPQDHRPPERARELKAGISRGLPTMFGRQSRSLSPQRTTPPRKAGGLSLKGPIRASQPTLATSDSVPYGRGQLNYPLPDLSKVEPRVRFPKDPQSYHPPRGKTLPARSKDSEKPVVFKSPAEIVREVLLSSGEGPPQKPPGAAISVIPEELKSPQQATELVHQLQEDYRKLLTKYAEAENTIDRLRLGAKVRLYADPPKPNQGLQMGTVSHASKVLTFSIPQVRSAKVTVGPDPAPDVAGSQGTGVRREDGFTSPEKPSSGEELTWALTGQASKFQKQVESLEELIRAGRLTPQEQLKGFARVKGAQDALEQAYLQARDAHCQRQKHQELEGAVGDFDPDRALEGEIFRQGMRLEALKERIQPAPGPPTAAWNHLEAPSPSPSSLLAQNPKGQMGSPEPSLQAPIPVSHVPQPEVAVPQGSLHRDLWDLEVSDEPGEDSQGLPEPLQRMRHQVEKDFGQLLDHYSHFKSLPGSLSFEQLHPEGQGASPEEEDGAAAGDAGREEGALQTIWRNKGTRMSSSSMKESRLRDASRYLSRKSQQLLHQACQAPSGQTEVPHSPEPAEKSRSSASAPGKSSRRQREHRSPPSSTASLADTSVSGSVAQKPFRKVNTASLERPLAPSHGEPPGDVGMSSLKHQDLRMVSPETDSGFVGSEASRTSPFAQVPKHRSTPSRSRNAMGKGTPAEEAVLTDPLREAPRAVAASPRHRFPADGLQGKGRARGHAFHIGAPPAWTGGIASEVEPSGESTPTDSEVEAQGGLNTYGPAPEEMGSLPKPSAALFSPARIGRSSFLDSRMERDQAITALQSEVFQLQQSLDETLGRPHSPTKHPPPSLHTLKHQVLGRAGARCSTRAKEMHRTSGDSRSASEPRSPVVDPAEGTKRPLVPPRETRENLEPSESDSSAPKSQNGKQQEPYISRAKSWKQALLRGPYTGTRYPFPAAKGQETPPARGLHPCSQCRDTGSRLGGHASSPTTQGCGSRLEPAQASPSPAQAEGEAKAGLLCRGQGKPSREATQAFAGEKPTARNSGAQPELSKAAATQQPGPWYTTVSVPAATMHYLPTVPVVPYPLPSIVYCPLSATTSTASPAGLPVYGASAFQATELKTWALQQQPQPRRSSRMLDSGGSLQDLHRSLRQAVEAAQDMKVTSQRMSRSLAWELSKAKDLRGSCLF